MPTDDSASSGSTEPTALFEKGEIVWAKAFPQPWCPCRIVKAPRSRVLLSPFGWDTTRWLPVSDIRKFEVNYRRMFKFVGPHLSGEIRLAVEELRRRTNSALMCPCRGSSDVRSEREVARVSMGFRPRELLDFVIDMAVDPWVDDEEGIVAARVSVQVDAFRCYRSVKASGRIHPAVADVSMGIENEGAADDCVEVVHEEATAVEVAQFDSCQEDEVISESSLGQECEGGDRELSYSSSGSGVVYGVTNPSDDFSIKLHEEECEVSQEPASEGAYTCLINSVDFSIFDSDEDSGSLLDTQPLSVTDGIESLNLAREGTIEKQNSCTGSSMRESVKGTPCCKSSSHAEDSCENVGNETEFLATSVDSSETKLENREYEATMTGESEVVNRQDEITMEAVSVVSSANSSQRTALCDEQELLTGVASHCDTYSPTEKLNNSADFLPSPSANLVGSVAVGETYTDDVILCLSPRATTASESVDCKRRHDSTFAGSNSSKLHKTTMPSSDARIISKHGILDHHDKETLSSTNAGVNVAMSHMGDAHSIVSYGTNAKGDSMRRHVKGPWKGLAQCLSRPSQWHKLYVSPLVRDTPISTSKVQKSSVTDKSSSLSKSLHMKFPKDFNLPSKEELEKRFSVFGPLDSSRTKIYSSTGAGRVVFLKPGDANSAYKHVRKRNIFGLFNVRFWVDENENYRKERECPDVAKSLLEHSSPSLIPDGKELSTPIVGQTTSNIESCVQDLSAPVVVQSTSNLKSCLKRPGSFPDRDMKKQSKVRFLMVTN